MTIGVRERLDYFTDRDDELAAYEQLWEPSLGERVLCLGGLSGIGKSTLLEFMLHRHQPRRPAVLVDLANPRLQAGYLFVTDLADRLRHLLPHLRWRGFDRARDRCDRQGERLRRIRPSINVRQIISVRGRKTTADRLSQASTVDSDALAVELTRRADQHDQASRHRLLKELCDVLAAATSGFAVLVDTYEVVGHAGDTQFKDWFDVEFVPTLLHRVPQARLVIAGREELPARLPQLTVDRWARSDSDTFLASHNLTDDALAEAIFAHCQGHPQVTALAVDVWKAGVSTGNPLRADQLRHHVDEKAAAKWLMQQLYERLPERLEKVVKTAVRLRRYQPELIGHLLGDEGQPVDDATYAALERLSLTEPAPGGGWRAHDLVREVADAYFRQWPEAYRTFHRQASAYLGNGGQRGSVYDSLYHAIAADESDAAERWFEVIEDRRQSLDRAAVEELISILEAPERVPFLQPSTVGLLRLEQAMLARRSADSNTGDDRTAAVHLVQTQILLSRACTSFTQAGSWWGMATAEHLLGDLSVRTDRLTEAEQRYEHALQLYQQVEARLGEANTLKAMGDLLVRTDRLTEAEQRYEHALQLYQQVEDRLGEANTLQAMGRLYSVMADAQRAEEAFAAALDQFESIGDRYSTATAFTYRGQHRVALRQREGMSDWRKAFRLAVGVDPYLFGQVVTITFGAVRRLLSDGDADEYLASAIALMLSTDEPTTHQPGEPDRENLDTVLAGFAVIRDLAALRATGRPPGNDERTTLLHTAHQVDQATGSGFGLTGLAEQILDALTWLAEGDDPLTSLLIGWIQAPTWDQSQTYLSEHHNVLGPEAQARLSALAAAHSSNQNLAVHLNLLHAAHTHGIDAAYQQLHAELDAARLSAVLRSWLALSAQQSASQAYLAEHTDQLHHPTTIAMLHEACQQDSADQQLWHHLGLLLLGKHSAAGYQAADGTTPDPLAQTQNHLANNNLDQALAWACLARAHADGLGALALGHVHLARDEPDDAGEALAHAAATVPTDQLSEILAAYDQLLAAQPDHPWRHAEYADALHRAGRTRDAATAYDHAVLLAPEDPSLRFNRAHFLFGLGRLTDAAADLLEVTRLRPHDVLGAQVLLAAIAWPNDNSAAVEHFEAALASPGERLTPFTRAYYRALALAGLGRIREATTELETAQPARTSDEFTLDATDAILLDRLRNPPLPGLDMLRELLQAVPETGMRSTSG